MSRIGEQDFGQTRSFLLCSWIISPSEDLLLEVSRIGEQDFLQTHSFLPWSSIMSPSEDLLLEVSRIDEKDFGYGSNYYYCTGASSTASSACLNHAI